MRDRLRTVECPSEIVDKYKWLTDAKKPGVGFFRLMGMVMNFRRFYFRLDE